VLEINRSGHEGKGFRNMLCRVLIAVSGVIAITLAFPQRVPAVVPGTVAVPAGATAITQTPPVYFHWFEYVGHDHVFDSPLPPGTYRNPVLAGFYPDPSITRAGSEFYLVNSTFTYFPGIPVFESRDLVHWRQVGHVIARLSELNFDGLGASRGIFAPAITFHDGLFYVVSTSVDAGGNFLSVARNPDGPWSDPIWLPQVDGIDPSLFFDVDGKVYLLNNGPPAGAPQYEGHRAIWIQEFDLAARKLVGPRKVLVNGGVDFAKKPVWIEGPRLYRHEGWYILMCAEGGTSAQHSEVVLRARSPWGPFEPFAGNPILTQRDLPADRSDPITNAGHADLVAGPDGHWWAIFLASRPYEAVHYNTGRETFLLPVTWRDGWPLILAQGQAIPYVAPAPGGGTEFSVVDSLPTPTTGNFTWRDAFDSPSLKPEWLQVRVPKQPWADLGSRPGWLTLHPLTAALDSLTNPSFLARRQQHLAFDASTELEIPTAPGVTAGLGAFQSESYWYFLGVRRRDASGEGAPPPGGRGPGANAAGFAASSGGDTGSGASGSGAPGLGTPRLRTLGSGAPGSRAPSSRAPLELLLEKRAGAHTEIVSRIALEEGVRLRLRISGNARAYSFYYDEDGSGWKPLKEGDDGSILSSDVAGGFVGAVVGPYARAEASGASNL
jgi:xylan 1,4-beta-xylosidase